MKNFATKTEFKPGTVWLAGAGPGDPGLLTLHTLHAMESADVIVFDALVSDAILGLAPEHTPREFAGKEAVSHPTNRWIYHLGSYSWHARESGSCD